MAGSTPPGAVVVGVQPGYERDVMDVEARVAKRLAVTVGVHRLTPEVRTRLLPALQCGQRLLIVAHGNFLRALCAVIDDLSEAELADLNLRAGQPLLYRLDDADNTFTPRGGACFDPAAHDDEALVAAEGGT